MIAGHQLYVVTVKAGGESADYSIASQSAQSWVRRVANDRRNSPDSGCTALPDPLSWTDLGVSSTATISCPNQTGFPNLRKVTVVSTYKSKEATHAVYYDAT